MIEKTEPLPFIRVAALADVSDDEIYEELARRWKVNTHKLRNKLTAVLCGLQLEAVQRPDPLEPVVVPK